jgi:hypothetical protein
MMWGDPGPGTWLPYERRLQREANRSKLQEEWDARDLANLRDREWARALAASEAWLGKPVSEEVRGWIRSYVDLATVTPAVATVWLRRGTRAAELVKPAMGIAIRGGKIVCPPITDVESLLTAFHELGHGRSAAWLGDGKRRRLEAANRSRVFHRELDAWRWARHHSPIWDDRCQRDMVQSLKDYLAQAELRDVEAVVAVETFCSYGEYASEIMRRVRLDQAAEMRQA